MSVEKLTTKVRQEQIAQATLEVIAERGLEGLNVAQVARQVGLVPSAIYRHFQNKDGILDAVVDLVRDRLHGNVRIVQEETTDAVERLHRLLTLHIRLIRENESLPKVIFSEFVFGHKSSRRDKMLTALKGYLREVGEFVREGQKQKRIHPDCDPGTVAVIFLGIVQSSAVLWHVSDGAFDVTRHAEKAWKTLCAGIAVRK
jgi:AcrR family transcriptional regulator